MAKRNMQAFGYIVINTKTEEVLKNDMIVAGCQESAVVKADMKAIAAEANCRVEDLHWTFWPATQFVSTKED